MTHTPSAPRRAENPRDDRPLLSPAAAEARLGITQRTLAALRRRGTGPGYIRLSAATIHYLRDDIEAASTEERLCRD